MSCIADTTHTSTEQTPVIASRGRARERRGAVTVSRFERRPRTHGMDSAARSAHVNREFAQAMDTLSAAGISFVEVTEDAPQPLAA